MFKDQQRNQQKAEDHFRGFMEALGLDVDNEHLRDTPKRVAESRMHELFRGLREDPRDHLETTFENVETYRGDSGWVIVDQIEVQSMCAHHFLPFRGHAHVGYIPQGEVVGLSKLARVVDGYARRPQVQENLTNQIADAIHEELEPLATMVVVEAEHECMTVRGVQEPESMTRTSAVRGAAHPTSHGNRSSTLKQEFFSLIGES